MLLGVGPRLDLLSRDLHTHLTDELKSISRIRRSCGARHELRSRKTSATAVFLMSPQAPCIPDAPLSRSGKRAGFGSRDRRERAATGHDGECCAGHNKCPLGAHMRCELRGEDCAHRGGAKGHRP